MTRKFNTTARGEKFNQSTIDAVWRKAIPAPGYSPDEYRYDICGKLIRYADYGDTSSQYGYELDHIYPVARGGSDNLDNLQVLYWETNRRKGDQYPFSC